MHRIDRPLWDHEFTRRISIADGVHSALILVVPGAAATARGTASAQLDPARPAIPPLFPALP